MKQLREYQKTAVERSLMTNLLNSDQMGLGKSLPAIETCKAMFELCNAPAIVICPKGLRLQWEGFILDQDPTANVSIANGDPFWLKTTVPKLDYLIVHYEAVVKFNFILAKHQYSTIVVDEAHRIKNHGTRAKPIARTRAVKSLKGFRKIALTGTPWDKNPGEIWSILNWLEPKKFTSYWQFMDEHINVESIMIGGWKDKKTGKKVGGTLVPKNYTLKDPKAFVEMLKSHMIRRRKLTVMPELPQIQITHIPIEIGITQRKAYEAIKHVKDMEVAFEDLSEPMFIQHVLTKLVRLLQCASDPQGLGLVTIPSAKLDWLADWCDDNPHESVLIFSRYRKTAERAARLVNADTLIMGGSALKTSLTASRRIVATIAAAAEGFDFGHIQTAIFIDCEWSSILMSQAQERIDRGGNTEPKNIIFLEAQNTVDSLVRDALENKWNTKQLIDSFLTGVTH